jgi:hypothetical protein
LFPLNIFCERSKRRLYFVYGYDCLAHGRVGNFLNLEATVKRILLSPVTTLLMSLSLVVGILVCDLTGLRALPAASAQTGAVRSVSVATLAGGVIAAKGVVINGVATDAVFLGSVTVSNSVIDAGRGITRFGALGASDFYVLGAYPSGDPEPVNGAYPSGDPDPVNGAYPSGDPEPVNGAYPSGDPDPVNGAYPSGDPDPVNGAYPSGVIYGGGGLEVIGGTLQGSNIQVTNGVISGENLVLVGAFVTSPGAQ